MNFGADEQQQLAEVVEDEAQGSNSQNPLLPPYRYGTTTSLRPP